MQEPAYILKNGRTVPYIPGTITTNREAYAASLHVLFKHVADFHICVVRVFSDKYGIPEDDILKTIQESDEFKNMHVDPVLCMDMSIHSLGYLDKAPVPESDSGEVIIAPVTAPVKPIVKKTKKSDPVPEPVAVIASEESIPTPVVEQEVKIKTIRKKITQAIVPTPEPPTPVAVVAEESRHDADTQPDLNKPKTIRKKIVPKPTQPITEPVKAASSVPTPAPATPSPAPATPAPATIAPTLAIANTEDAPRKIIKKKAKSTA
jgi:hypothetical protein